MADEKATLEQSLDALPQQGVENEEAAIAAEPAQEPKASETPEVKEEPKTDPQAELVAERERRIRAEAQAELLREQLETVVVNQAKPQVKESDIVVDDGFVQSTDEQIDAMTPAQLYRYQKAETAHNERVKAAKTANETQVAQAQANAPNPTAIKQLSKLKELYGEELMEDIAPFMLRELNKDVNSGKPAKQIFDYFDKVKPMYEKITGVKIGQEQEPENKTIPIESIPKKSPQPKVVVSEKPSGTATGKTKTAADLDTALDEGMKAGFGTTGRIPKVF